MEIVINTSDSAPLFAQLVEQIKKAVLSGDLSPESRLPSIRQLANDLELSHNMVTKAYRLLGRDSIIQTRRYRGAFIHPDAKPDSTVDLNAWGMPTMRRNKQMQEITRLEADELVFNHGIVEQSFYQDKKAIRFDFTLGNDQSLIIKYNHDTKEKSCFVMPYKNIEEQIHGNNDQHQRFGSAVYAID